MDSIISVKSCVACTGPTAAQCTEAVCGDTPTDSVSKLGSLTRFRVNDTFGYFNANTTKCSAVCDPPYGYKVQDQPYCLLKHVVWGTLGHCGPGATGIRAVNASGRACSTTTSNVADSTACSGNVKAWAAEGSGCVQVDVTECHPEATAPALCGQWDFFSGAKATTFRVPKMSPTSTKRAHEWIIWETGERLLREPEMKLRRSCFSQDTAPGLMRLPRRPQPLDPAHTCLGLPHFISGQ